MARLAAGLAQRPPGAQVAGLLALERAARLHVQRLIDGLGRHPHLRVVGELAPQPPAIFSGDKRRLRSSYTSSRNRALLASLAGFGRLARSNARACAVVAR